MKLFTFSATGNTLTTARLLADALDEPCEAVSLALLRDAPEIPVEDDAVGILFPIYYLDMPWLVRDAVRRMRFSGTPYIFALATCRMHAGPAAARLDALLREQGQRLHWFGSLLMPGNSHRSTDEQIAEELATQADRVRQAAAAIAARTEQDCAAPLPAPSPLEAGPANERGLCAEDVCNGCGVCVSVCPMDNIRVENGHAEIGDRCVICLSCYHWCPVKAIWMPKFKDNERRPQYRHPDVTLDDILAERLPRE